MMILESRIRVRAIACALVLGVLAFGSRPTEAGSLGLLAEDSTTGPTYTLIAVVNTASSSNTITVEVRDSAGLAVADKTKLLAAGETWLVSTAQGIANPQQAAANFTGSVCVSDTEGDLFFAWGMLSVTILSGNGTPFSMTAVNLEWTQTSSC